MVRAQWNSESLEPGGKSLSSVIHILCLLWTQIYDKTVTFVKEVITLAAAWCDLWNHWRWFKKTSLDCFRSSFSSNFCVSGRSGFCGLIEELFWTPCASVFLASALNWVALERKRFWGLENKITSQADDAGGDVSWSSVFAGSFRVASERRETGL